jgi:hypothetical protein
MGKYSSRTIIISQSSIVVSHPTSRGSYSSDRLDRDVGWGSLIHTRGFSVSLRSPKPLVSIGAVVGWWAVAGGSRVTAVISPRRIREEKYQMGRVAHKREASLCRYFSNQMGSGKFGPY